MNTAPITDNERRLSVAIQIMTEAQRLGASIHVAGHALRIARDQFNADPRSAHRAIARACSWMRGALKATH